MSAPAQQRLTYTVTCLDPDGNRIISAVPVPVELISAAHGYAMQVSEADPELDPRVESLQYPLGSTVFFGDCTATVATENIGDDLVIAEGTVNGLPLETRAHVYVPVWANRVDRDSTTVHVHAANIVGVDKAPLLSPGAGNYGE